MEHSHFNKEPNIKQVNHQNDNTMRYILSSLIVCTALAFPIGEGGSAYAQKVVHDKQKEKQWRSMETGAARVLLRIAIRRPKLFADMVREDCPEMAMGDVK